MIATGLKRMRKPAPLEIGHQKPSTPSGFGTTPKSTHIRRLVQPSERSNQASVTLRIIEPARLPLRGWDCPASPHSSSLLVRDNQ
jgi:hypothetical protein